MSIELKSGEEMVRKIRVVATILGILAEQKDGYDFVGMETVFGFLSEELEEVLESLTA